MRTLYKLDATGRVRTWSIGPRPGGFLITYGVLGQGEITETYESSDPDTEMDRRYTLQCNIKGYTTFIPEARPERPMLASKYNPAKLQDPVYVQPKLDGMRAFLSSTELVSRLGTPIVSVPHITLPESIPYVLDGELLAPGGLQHTLSLCKREDPAPDHTLVEFHVFDIAIEGVAFEDRLTILQSLTLPESVKLVPWFIKPVQDEWPLYWKEHPEGLILRNPLGLYEYNVRSSNLQKYKYEVEETFEIVGIEKGHKDVAVFVCKSTGLEQTNLRQSKTTFRVNPAMSTEIKQSIYRNREKYVGWKCLCRFSRWTESYPSVPYHARALTLTKTDIDHQA